ncbi:glycosyltransferase family 4 protein [Allostreptomyces psammosilenae]|uniref:D-inositol 3-phosphate glycosyltransferase n=1 Tax=Allostreptomyces psammosilenae TaxID=1892865 RepID=A0A853A9P5_9ACTN|nr:glycosyltransferase family 4 protein [Allostreptomyces psammosilenae]NYI07341.1 glycosyltransferase involved in cell wall biosynthesis [Allostreptomyces psammosilenae]
MSAVLSPQPSVAEPIDLGLLVDSAAFGGPEAYVRQLLRRLPGEFRCHLVAAAPVAARLRDAAAERGASVTVIPLVRGLDRAPGLEWLLAARPVDVWHVSLLDPRSNRAALVAALAHAPTVATLHMPRPPAEPPVTELSGLYRRLSGVIALSAEIADTLRVELGLPDDRVHRVRPGVDIPLHVLSSAPPDARQPLRIGAVGRLTGRKGFDVLVEAVRLLHQRGHRFTVEIAGEGPHRAALAAAAHGLPVTFPGFVEDVPAFLNRLDLFCLPSRAEALPLALLEAMAAALPCVTTPVGDIPAVLGDAVRTVPPDDPGSLAAALEQLLLVPEARRRLALRARAFAERELDAATMVTAIAHLLTHAAHPTPSPTPLPQRVG